MQILGRIDQRPKRPFVCATLLCPDLSIEKEVQFAIDTGSQDSVIMPVDAWQMKIDYGRLQKPENSYVNYWLYSVETYESA